MKLKGLKQFLFQSRKLALATFSLMLALSIGLSSTVQYVYASSKLSQNHIALYDNSLRNLESIESSELELNNLRVEEKQSATTALQTEQINQSEALKTHLQSDLDKQTKSQRADRSADRLDFVKASQIVNSKIEAMNTTVYSAELLVNGKVVAYFKTIEEANWLLNQYKNAYIKGGSELISIDFNETVEARYEHVPYFDFTGYSDVEQATQYIRSGTKEQLTYRIVKGDTVEGISKKHNITVDDLYAANPILHEQKYLQIDQELSLVVPVPIINVVAKDRVTYTEAIPYEVTTEQSGSLYKGDKQVKRPGKEGETVFVAERSIVNGVVKDKVILSEEVVKDPVTKILVVGTKARPASIGTGKFARPTVSRYTITSRFGVMRKTGRHKGIDLAMPYGSPINAADGGRVTFAGWKGTYGRLVIIDHGAGKQTYYGHCSALLVSAGDKVFKGQRIAKVGSTGRSTGPHLHFEIRINGTPVNPTRYVSL